MVSSGNGYRCFAIRSTMAGYILNGLDLCGEHGRFHQGQFAAGRTTVGIGHRDLVGSGCQPAEVLGVYWCIRSDRSIGTEIWDSATAHREVDGPLLPRGRRCAARKAGSPG